MTTDPKPALANRSPFELATPVGAGAVLAMLLGAGLAALAIGAASREMPLPLTITLALAGLAEISLGWFTLRRRRAAWAFATALAGTASVAFFFSAPKIRDALEIALGVALVPSIVAASACVLLAVSESDFD